MTSEQSIKLDTIAAYMGSPLTEEQKEFASDFTRDIISFSNPGTGKTHTLTAGLIMSQVFHKVPGREINCMSFTNAAVSEMAGRYQKLCKKVGLTPSVVFNTFHSLSLKIMKDAYPSMRIIGQPDYKTDIEDLMKYMTDLGIDCVGNIKYVRKVLRAINDLNSSLTFHPDNVARKYAYKQLDINLDTFQELRKSWFLRGIILNTIVQGDIPLYCLYALMNKPEIIDKWKGKFRIMVVDEFQDLSLLHLHILSYIAKTLIVIGDMKQQIYAFNGACPQIVREYFKLHPNAVECNLTQSFRCGQAVAEFATNIIKPNDQSIQCFTGHDRGSSVNLVTRRDLDWKKIVADIEADRKLHGNAGCRDIMFLYRNNASAIPLIDELYKKGIPYRCPKFAQIMEIPLFESLSKLVNAAWQPLNIKFVSEALRLFPEFKDTSFGLDPLPCQVITQTGKDLFDLPYRFKESSSTEILAAMRAAKACIDTNKSAGAAYMKVLPVYRKYIFKNEWWKLDNTEEWYFNLVAPIANNKPYPLMYNEEIDKSARNTECMQANMGIRCFTMHSAKGLEADDVYILDCDEGLFPNKKVMEDKVKADCDYDVSVDIRSERNLLYVAITRAKYNVTISYAATPSKLLSNPEDMEYHQYDAVYEREDIDYNDADSFFELFKIGKYKDAG
mgnify:CR=1 FL=1